MTVEIKHPFVSLKADGGDGTLVRPSNWNEAHSFSMAGPSLLGRIDSGTGSLIEVPLGAGLAFQSGMLTALVRAIPVGLILPYAGNNEPPGWLWCDGRAVSSTTYEALASICLDKFGTGAPAGSFYLPDMRGRVPAGKDNIGGAAANRLTNATFPTGAIDVGKVSGTERHILTNTELPTHEHVTSENKHRHFVATDLALTADSTPNLAALETVTSQNTANEDNAYILNGLPYLEYPANRGNTSEAAHTHTVTMKLTDAEGDPITYDQPHLNLQPTMTVVYLIFSGVYP